MVLGSQHISASGEAVQEKADIANRETTFVRIPTRNIGFSDVTLNDQITYLFFPNTIHRIFTLKT